MIYEYYTIGTIQYKVERGGGGWSFLEQVPDAKDQKNISPNTELTDNIQ